MFSPSGPDAQFYGAAEGFPVPNRALALQQGNPYEPRYRVGAFSHIDEIYPTRKIERAAAPWMFKRSQADFSDSYRGNHPSLTEYLAHNPVTGLLIARDDEILFEHYQYGRTDHDRLVSQSMVKSITGILIGIAIAEGAIKSIDDVPETYVPGFKGTEYGKTPIRDLLHMSSGVEFREDQDNGRDLNRLWRDMVLGSGTDKGTIGSIAQFNRRIAPPGTQILTMPASKPTYSASSFIMPSTNRPPTICRKNSGNRSAPKPTLRGFWMRKDLNWRISASTPCCAITRGSDACSPMMARGRAGNSFRHNG